MRLSLLRRRHLLHGIVEPHGLIHPNTTNPKRDHLIDPIWIGRALAVEGEVLGEEDEAEEVLEVNTEPTLGV